ncbi:IS701 family transposase [Streptomyces sp. NPDC054864]
MGRIAGRFAPVEPRRRTARLVLGFLADLPRKNCWTIAEWAGEATPHGMQHLLCRRSWDADAVRDGVRGYVVEYLRDNGAVLVVDETGDVKKRAHTVGVQRRYTGIAGRIENSQVAVYLVYAGSRGHAAVDRELYIPGSRAPCLLGCRRRGLRRQPETACRTGKAWPRICPCRRLLSQVTTPAGKFRADTLAGKLPKRAWQKLSAGVGAKGYRRYDWAVIDTADLNPGHRQLLIRRSRNTCELAYYRCYSPQTVPLTTLVKVAGSGRRVEETFQAEKGLAGLDEHQVRRYVSWTRWVTLAMLAHAFLAIVRGDEHTRTPGAIDLIPLTCNEIQRLFITLLVQTVHDAAHRLGWSDWRRRHQARAQASRFRRQAATQI